MHDKNSEPKSGSPLFYGSLLNQIFRISAAGNPPLAVNFLQKQQKQQKQPRYPSVRGDAPAGDVWGPRPPTDVAL